MSPHPFLNPNATITRKQRDALPFPLMLKKTPVIKNVFRQEYKDASYWAAVTSLSRLSSTPTTLSGPVVLEVVIAYERGRKIPDWDNAVAMLKAAIDGVTLAGFMKNDKQVIGMFMKQIKSISGEGYTDLTVRKATDEEINRTYT